MSDLMRDDPPEAELPPFHEAELRRLVAEGAGAECLLPLLAMAYKDGLAVGYEDGWSDCLAEFGGTLT